MEVKTVNIMSEVKLQPAIRTIIARVEEKKFLKDKFLKDYLLLGVNNDNPIFVFSGKVKQLSWNELKEGSEYKFVIEEGKGSNNLLVSFEKRG